MKKMILLFALVFLNLSFAYEKEGGIHTPNYCSMENSATCAHLKFEKFPTTSVEGEFLVHIISSSGQQVSDLDVKIWWDLGNGDGRLGAPVELEASDELNHFHIQNAWFLKVGQWQVLLNFTDAGIKQKIIVPLEIKE